MRHIFPRFLPTYFLEERFQSCEDVFKKVPDKNLLPRLLIRRNYRREVSRKEREKERNALFAADLDHQKLEREARICRYLKHPNIGKYSHECSISSMNDELFSSSSL